MYLHHYCQFLLIYCAVAVTLRKTYFFCCDKLWLALYVLTVFCVLFVTKWLAPKMFHTDAVTTADIDFLVRPKTIVFGRTYVLRMMFFLLFNARSPRCVGRPA